MIVSWMAYAVVVGVLVAVAARLGESAAHLLRLPVRWVPAASLGIIGVLTLAAPYRTVELTIGPVVGAPGVGPGYPGWGGWSPAEHADVGSGPRTGEGLMMGAVAPADADGHPVGSMIEGSDAVRTAPAGKDATPGGGSRSTDGADAAAPDRAELTPPSPAATLLHVRLATGRPPLSTTEPAPAPGREDPLTAALTGAAATVGTERLRAIAPWAKIAWAGASGSIVLVLLGTAATAARRRRRWPKCMIAGTPVRIAPEAGPAVIGVLRPEIVVPRWLLARSAEEVRLAVAHEREHVAAGDTRLLFAASLVAALIPWNPAAWWLLGRLRLGVETDCDRRLLRAGVRRRTYGALLLDIAERSPRPRLSGALGLLGTRSHLERRLLAMTTTRVRYGAMRAVGLAAAAMPLLLAACSARMPDPAAGQAALAGGSTPEIPSVAASTRATPATGDTPVRMLASPALAPDAAEPARGTGDGARQAVAPQRPPVPPIPQSPPAAPQPADGPPPPAPAAAPAPPPGTPAPPPAPPEAPAAPRPAPARVDAQASPGVPQPPTPIPPAPLPAKPSAGLDTIPRGAPIVIRGEVSHAVAVFSETGDAGRPPLLVIDGVITTMEPLPNDPRAIVVDGVQVAGSRVLPLPEGRTIETIEIVKGTAALELYGDRASGGVVIVRTRATDPDR